MSCLWKVQGGRRENGRDIAREVGGDLGEVGQWVSRAGYHCFLSFCAHLVS